MSVYDYTGEIGDWLKSLEEPSDGGLVNEEEEIPATVSSNDSDEELRKREREQLAPVEEIFSSMHDHVQSMYGDPKGWKGTPMEGLQGFAQASKREPIFGYTGQYDRGGNPEIRQRIDASTRYASPPSGLVGGMVSEGRNDVRFKSAQDRSGIQSLPYQTPRIPPKPPGMTTAVGNYGIQHGRTGTAGTEIHSPYGTASLKAPPLSPIPQQAIRNGSLSWTPQTVSPFPSYNPVPSTSNGPAAFHPAYAY